ncbi:hypothetical protein JTB14_034868 [Gonioctena quinquepunctata]|nr:hypothetical protein JTB14_034868 [Gonioctena quinquepunctata]
MNINLPAPQIPIPEAIAEPAPSISATVLEPTPSHPQQFLKLHYHVRLPKYQMLLLFPRKQLRNQRKTAKKQQSEIWTSTPMKDTLVLKEAKRDGKNDKQKITNKRKLNTRGKGKQTKVNIKKTR